MCFTFLWETEIWTMGIYINMWLFGISKTIIEKPLLPAYLQKFNFLCFFPTFLLMHKKWQFIYILVQYNFIKWCLVFKVIFYSKTNHSELLATAGRRFQSATDQHHFFSLEASGKNIYLSVVFYVLGIYLLNKNIVMCLEYIYLIKILWCYPS